MKFGLAYCLLLVYLAAIVKPVIPIIKDAIAHSFWRIEHIKIVHHSHGHHHTHIEIKSSSDKDKETPTATRYQEPVSVHIFTHKRIEIARHYSFVEKNYPDYMNVLSNAFRQVITPPPKA